MRLVVDSNILFTFFWKDSTFSKLCTRSDLALIAPEFALEEIKKYNKEIRERTKITSGEFEKRREELVNRVSFVPVEAYASAFPTIKKLAETFKEHADEILRDIDFLALALQQNLPLWTYDKLLQKQNMIKIITTANVIDLL